MIPKDLILTAGFFLEFRLKLQLFDIIIELNLIEPANQYLHLTFDPGNNYSFSHSFVWRINKRTHQTLYTDVCNSMEQSLGGNFAKKQQQQ